MDRTIELADELIRAAQEATGESDERIAIEKAVTGFVGRAAEKKKQRLSLSRYAGKFEFAEGYDVLKERGARGLSD